MKRILPLSLARYALTILIFVLAISGTAHRFDAKAAMAYQTIALSGFSPADICGGDSEGAVSGHCQACIFAASLGMPPQADSTFLLHAKATSTVLSDHVHYTPMLAKHSPARAPPQVPFA